MIYENEEIIKLLFKPDLSSNDKMIILKNIIKNENNDKEAINIILYFCKSIEVGDFDFNKTIEQLDNLPHLTHNEKKLINENLSILRNDFKSREAYNLFFKKRKDLLMEIRDYDRIINHKVNKITELVDVCHRTFNENFKNSEVLIDLINTEINKVHTALISNVYIPLNFKVLETKQAKDYFTSYKFIDFCISEFKINNSLNIVLFMHLINQDRQYTYYQDKISFFNECNINKDGFLKLNSNDNSDKIKVCDELINKIRNKPSYVHMLNCLKDTSIDTIITKDTFFKKLKISEYKSTFTGSALTEKIEFLVNIGILFEMPKKNGNPIYTFHKLTDNNIYKDISNFIYSPIKSTAISSIMVQEKISINLLREYKISLDKSINPLNHFINEIILNSWGDRYDGSLSYDYLTIQDNMDYKEYIEHKKDNFNAYQVYLPKYSRYRNIIDLQTDIVFVKDDIEELEKKLNKSKYHLLTLNKELEIKKELNILPSTDEGRTKQGLLLGDLDGLFKEIKEETKTDFSDLDDLFEEEIKEEPKYSCDSDLDDLFEEDEDELFEEETKKTNEERLNELFGDL